jgi:hypothetical protein
MVGTYDKAIKKGCSCSAFESEGTKGLCILRNAGFEFLVAGMRGLFAMLKEVQLTVQLLEISEMII